MNDIEQANKIIEDAVGQLYRGFFQLRRAGEYQEEYDSMGTIIGMLMSDRLYLAKKYEIIPREILTRSVYENLQFTCAELEGKKDE